MARIDTLSHFLSDVADAIRTKKSSSELIAAEDFDTEILSIVSSGGGDDPDDPSDPEPSDYAGFPVALEPSIRQEGNVTYTVSNGKIYASSQTGRVFVAWELEAGVPYVVNVPNAEIYSSVANNAECTDTVTRYSTYTPTANCYLVYASKTSSSLNSAYTVIQPGPRQSNPVDMRFNFANAINANCYGNVELYTEEADYCNSTKLYWADDSGIMSNYTELNIYTTITLSSGSVARFDAFNEYNAIPKYAKKIVAVQTINGTATVVGEYSIPSSKLWNSDTYGTHDYSVGVISDVHYQYEAETTPPTTDTVDAIAYMLQYMDDRSSVEAIIVPGDLTDNGSYASLEEWKTVRDANHGTTPVYACNGNHESWTSAALNASNPSQMRPYLDTDYVDETDNYFSKTIGGDLYIFMPCFEGATARADNSDYIFTTDSLNKLEADLEQHRNERVILLMHILPSNALISNGFGTGHGAYSLNLWGASSEAELNTNAARFINMIKHYTNVVWISGHSHIKYQYQEMWTKLNACRYSVGGAMMLHISSVVVPRDLLESSSQPGVWRSISEYIYAESEGSIIDVYPNALRVRSRNFLTNKFYGLCEYLIDTTPVTIPPSGKTLESITATLTGTYTTDNSLSDVTSNISVTATYSDNTTADVTSSATFDTSNVDMTTAGTYSIGVSYGGKSDTISLVVGEGSSTTPTLESIAATLTGTYDTNDSISDVTSNITVTATYSDNSTANVTSSATISTSNVTMSTAGTYSITVSYTEGGVTKTATVSVTVAQASAPFLERGVNLSTSTGLPDTANNNYAATDFIPVSGRTCTYGYTGAINVNGYPKVTPLCYDSNKSFAGKLSEQSSGGTITKTYSSGTAYVRLRLSLSGLTDEQFATLNENTITFIDNQ